MDDWINLYARERKCHRSVFPKQSVISHDASMVLAVAVVLSQAHQVTSHHACMHFSACAQMSKADTPCTSRQVYLIRKVTIRTTIELYKENNMILW